MLQASLPSQSALVLHNAPPVEKPSKPERIAYIEYFRAIAMIMIVTGHTYALAWTHGVQEDLTTHATPWNALPAFINGGTALFVFISGFLYRHLFYERVAYSDFLKRKCLYVGLPYLIIASPIALALIGIGAFKVSVIKEGIPYPESYFVDYIALISTGRMITAYWYIPCAMLLFAATPLFDRFIRLPSNIRWAAFAASIFLALWIHRPLDNLDPAHSFLYFINFYMFGILFCEYRTRIMPILQQHHLSILAVGAVVAIAMTQAMTGRIDNIERQLGDGWLPIGFDLILVQKYAAIFALIAVLNRFGHLCAAPLSFIARYSFGIFFMHGVVLAVLMRLPVELTPHIGMPFLDLTVYSAVVIGISTLLVLAIKQITGRYSRYIIGS